MASVMGTPGLKGKTKLPATFSEPLALSTEWLAPASCLEHGELSCPSSSGSAPPGEMVFSEAYQFGFVLLALASETCCVCGWPEGDECVCACLCECVFIHLFKILDHLIVHFMNCIIHLINDLHLFKLINTNLHHQF